MDKPTNFKLALRIRHGVGSMKYMFVDKVEFDVKNGYAILNRTWNDNDNIVLSMDMPVELMVSHLRLGRMQAKFALCAVLLFIVSRKLIMVQIFHPLPFV